MLHDPRTKMIYDDARHFVLTTTEKFDIITSDPIHPWVKGSATLYSKEYFELVKQHLNPGGVITQWVPLYESDAETVKSEIATFFDAFPNGTIWGNDISTAAATTWCCWGRWTRRRSTWTRCRRAWIVPKAGAWRTACARWASAARCNCSPPTPARNPTCGPGWRARRSIATAICGCNTWPGWRST